MRVHIIDQHQQLPESYLQTLQARFEATTGTLWSECTRLDPRHYDAVIGVWDYRNRHFLTVVKEILQETNYRLRLYLLINHAMIGNEFARVQHLGISGIIPLSGGEQVLLQALEDLENHVESSSESVMAMGLRNQLSLLSERILSQFPVGCILFGVSQRAVWANPSAFDMLGIEAEDVIGHDLTELLPEAIAQTVQEFWKILTSPDCVEALNIQYPRRERLFHLSFYPIREDSQEEPLLGVALMIFTTGTDQEGYLGRLRKMHASLHDALTELQSLETGVELARQSAEEGAPDAPVLLNRVLPQLNVTENHLTEANQQLGVLLRNAQQKTRQFDLIRLISDAFQNFEVHFNRKHVELRRVGISQGELTFSGNPSTLYRVFSNLFRNIARHCKADSKVVLSLDPTEQGCEVELRYEPKRMLTQGDVDRILSPNAAEIYVQFGDIMNLRSVRNVIMNADGLFDWTPANDHEMIYRLTLNSTEGNKALDSGLTFVASQMPFVSLLVLETSKHAEPLFHEVGSQAHALVRMVPDLVRCQEALQVPGNHHLLINLFQFGDELPILAKLAQEHRAKRISVACYDLAHNGSPAVLSLARLSQPEQVVTQFGAMLSERGIILDQDSTAGTVCCLGSGEGVQALLQELQPAFPWLMFASHQLPPDERDLRQSPPLATLVVLTNGFEPNAVLLRALLNSSLRHAAPVLFVVPSGYLPTATGFGYFCPKHLGEEPGSITDSLIKAFATFLRGEL